jgi:hypothetical protein
VFFAKCTGNKKSRYSTVCLKRSFLDSFFWHIIYRYFARNMGGQKAGGPDIWRSFRIFGRDIRYLPVPGIYIDRIRGQISTSTVFDFSACLVLGTVIRSVADPDDFWPDPDPTCENVRIRIRFRIRFRIRILTLINFRPIFFWIFFWWKYAIKSIFMDQKV